MKWKRADLIRRQLQLLPAQPADEDGLALPRATQELAGKLLRSQGKHVTIEQVDIGGPKAFFARPQNPRSRAVILYLHGGGYTTGGAEYCQGFGTVLAEMAGLNVLCIAYRLAPEHPFPAALDDAECAYRYLLASGFPRIAICGESAGGGLSFVLALRARDEGLVAPCCVAAISPWVDLTLSGESYQTNADRDPTLTRTLLGYDAACYAGGQPLTHPYLSPLMADLRDMPASLIFAGSDELLLSEAIYMRKQLIAAGSPCDIVIAPGMWHAYLLYCLRETKRDMAKLITFLWERTA